MAMKPHLLLLLLLIAPILYKSMSVGDIASDVENFIKGLSKRKAEDFKLWSMKAKEEVNIPITWEQEWQICIHWVYYYENQINNDQQLTLATLTAFQMYLKQAGQSLSFVNFCIDTMKEVLQVEQQNHP